MEGVAGDDEASRFPFACFVLFCFALLSTSMTAAREAEDDRLIRFDIPRQRADLALIEFAEQADVTFIFPADQARKVTAKAVRGEFTSQQAIRLLLEGTGLQPGFRTGGAWTVKVDQNSDKGITVKMRRFLAGLISVVTGGAALGADGAASGSANVEEIVVTGYRFLDEDTSGTTNLPLPIEKVPQSISLVSADFIKAADLKILGDVAQYTPGALYAGNGEGFGSKIKLRGFVAGHALDGLTNLGAYEPDYAIIERMEIVKGPSSVVYGTASPGGLINMVTKSAKADTIDYLSVTAGMWNQYRLEGQLSGPLDTDGRVRVIGVAAREEGDSFMEISNHDRTVLYGGIDADLSESVSGYLHGGYESYTRSGFDGIPTLSDGSPAPVSRSFFIGSADERFELVSDLAHAEAGIDWDVSDPWQISFKGSYRSHELKGAAPFGFDLQDNGDISLDVDNRRSFLDEDMTIGASSVYELDHVGLEDSFISVSVLYQKSLHDNRANFATFPGGGTANIFDGVDAVSRVIESAQFPDSVTRYITDMTMLAYSAQGLVQVTDSLSVLLGASYSKAEADRDYPPIGPTRYDFDAETSYRGGLIYELTPDLNAYFSYSESFQPQFSIDVSGNLLPPLTGEQIEVGLKYAPQGSRLLVTGALFQILQKNKAEFDQRLDGLDRFRPIGEVRHRGAEIEVTGQLTDRWELHAGYAYLDPEITETSNTSRIGTQVPFLPEHTASLFSTYFVTDAFSIGAGVRYVDSVRTSVDGSTKDLPAYTVVDATAGYVLGRLDFRLSAHNLLDEHYYINTYDTLFYGNVVGPPANVSLSVRYSF